MNTEQQTPTADVLSTALLAIFPANMRVPKNRLARGTIAFLKEFEGRTTLPEGVVGLTEDSKPMFRGDVLFDLRCAHGFPLDFALDRIINDEGMAVDWVAFIEAARRNQWWDYQTYETICHAMVDAALPREMQAAIRLRFQRYVMANEHPKMKADAVVNGD
jgi:alanyl-tRNA synthetase